ncbi:MAG: hypothetical protein M0R40_00285 [Firmicutes bacterium]|nr:hypothetical protein [Bacillota bacterium]
MKMRNLTLGVKQISNLINWIRGRYYKFKYRAKDAAAVGIFFCDDSKDKKNDFYGRLDEMSKTIKPCHKTIAQLQNYIVEKYNAIETLIGEWQLEQFKVGIILNSYPELLHTPQIEVGDKFPKRAEFLKWHENNEKRFAEARKYPIEKLGLVVSHYTFDYALESGRKLTFQITMEEKTEQCIISASADGKLSEAENKLMQSISHDIDLYKGVSQKDIDTRTPRFLAYATTLMKIDKEQNILKKVQ